jgi:hypothetical protein
VARRRWQKVHATYTLRSGFEKRVAIHLDECKVTYEYENERIAYTVPESKHVYIPDFTLANGIRVEVKGNFDAKSRQKMAFVTEQNPDLDIRMLFMSDNKISKSSKTRYSDWCEKRGLEYHVSPSGTIPTEWLVENPIKKEKPQKETKCRKKKTTPL